MKNAIDWASHATFGVPNSRKRMLIAIAGIGQQSYDGVHRGWLAAVALRESTMVNESLKIHLGAIYC